MKNLIYVFLLTAFGTYAQTYPPSSGVIVLSGTNADGTARIFYMPATPLNSPGNRIDVVEIKGIDYWKFMNNAVIFSKFGGSGDGVAGLTSDGNLKRFALANFQYTPDSDNSVSVDNSSRKLKVNPNVVMMAQTANDSIASIRSKLAAKANVVDVYTKSQSNSLFLQSESDPLWTIEKPNYYTKSQTDTRFLQSYTESDPVYTSGIANYYNKPQSDGRYLQSYNETDPVWQSEKTNYATNAAVSSGLSLKQNNLGFNPVNPNGTNLQYIAGDGSKITFPAIPSNNNQLTNGQGYITSAGVNNASVIAALGANPLFSEIDGGVNNEGALTVGAGTSTTSIINSNTTGSTPITLTAGTGVNIAESGNTITISTSGTSGATGTFNTVNVSNGLVTSGNNSTSASATRAFNTNFKISTTQSTRVSYSFTHTIALTLLLASGSTSAFLEISPDNGSGAPTGVWTTISQAGYSDGVSVAVSLSKATTNNVQGEIPANTWARIRTAGTNAGLTSGVPNVTYNCGQETTY